MTRDEVFDSLHAAHGRAWDRAPDRDTVNSRYTGTRLYLQFHAWRMAWWHELEKTFPEKIKGGILCLSPRSDIFPQVTSANMRIE